jgi:ribosomal protein L25 (general stress protein Ctc)
MATAKAAKTRRYLWVRSAHPQTLLKHNSYSLILTLLLTAKPTQKLAQKQVQSHKFKVKCQHLGLGSTGI